MTEDEKVQKVAADMQNTYAKVKTQVDRAMPHEHGDLGAHEAAKGLVAEGITAVIVTAGALASISLHLKGIHEELVKANTPTNSIFATKE